MMLSAEHCRRGHVDATIFCAVLMVGATAIAQTPTSTRILRVPEFSGRTYPGVAYMQGLSTLAAGDPERALRDLGEGVRFSTPERLSPWVNWVCCYAMAGEAHYRLGNNAQAKANFEEAIRTALDYPYWTAFIQTGATFKPSTLPPRKVPWGQSRRTREIAKAAWTVRSGTGSIGRGSSSRSYYHLVSMPQVTRALSLALRRRRELLGSIAADDALSRGAIELFARSAPRVAWGSLFLELQHGMALLGAGRDTQAALSLEQSQVLFDRYDHPLTGMALLELGRTAMNAGLYEKAAACFEEATYAAVDFNDSQVLEEAFHLGSMLHLATRRSGVYPLLEPALAWARKNKDFGHLYQSLLASSIENVVYAGDLDTCAALVTEAKRILPRLRETRAAARLRYAAAFGSFACGDQQSGKPLLTAAMQFQKRASTKVYQRQIVADGFRQQQIAPRKVVEVLTALLADPTPEQWMLDPMEEIASTTVSRTDAFEALFEASLLAPDTSEAVFDVAERMKRDRFLNSLEMNGRVAGLAMLAGGPDSQLDERSLLQRQEMRARYPRLFDLSRRAGEIDDQLRQTPVAASDDAMRLLQTKLLEQLQSVSTSQDVMLHEIALRREPCLVSFPPVRPLAEIQANLAEKQALLSFLTTGRGAYAFLVTSERMTVWKPPAPSALLRMTGDLLQEVGCYDANGDLGPDVLASAAWRANAHTLFLDLIKDAKVLLPYDFEELVIVPDGALWYLPFEALEVDDGAGGTAPLITRVRVRYAPLASLAVGDRRPRYAGGNTAVALGKLFPSDDDQRALDAFDALAPLVPEATALRSPLPASSAVYSTLFNRLVVLADIPPASGLSWSPVPFDRAPDAKLSDWLALPLGGPEQVVLPGFHTAAERALKGMSVEGAGQEVFLSLCGLMANGARTILLSRWRAGGETSATLVREFLQELPYTTASDAWQRSVLIARETPLDPAAEPRMRKESGQPTLADHPFFWSGYMLVDTGAPHTADEQQPQQNQPMPGDVVPIGDAGR